MKRHHKSAEIFIIANKVEFKPNLVRIYKEGHYILCTVYNNGAINQEDVTITNMYSLKLESQFNTTKQKWT